MILRISHDVLVEFPRKCFKYVYCSLKIMAVSIAESLSCLNQKIESPMDGINLFQIKFIGIFTVLEHQESKQDIIWKQRELVSS